MCTYVCQMFVFLPTFIFVRALFGKTLSTRTREARLDTLVEVSARSVHSGARGGRSKVFSRREWRRRIPWFRYERPYFVPGTYVLVTCCPFSPLGSHGLRAHSSDIGQVYNRQHGSHRSNAAAHTTCVCDTLICAILLWLVVFVGACRRC